MSRDGWAGKKIGGEGGVLDFRDGEVSAGYLLCGGDRRLWRTDSESIKSHMILPSLLI